MNFVQAFEALRSTGLAREPDKSIQFTDEPKIPGYLTFSSEKADEKYRTEDAFGQGYDWKTEAARFKSLAEYHERLSMFNPRKGLFSEPIAYDGSSGFVDPSAFFYHSDQQVPDKDCVLEKIRNQRYRWVAGKDVLGNTDVLLPAQRIFLSDFSDEFSIGRETTSNGGAFGEKGTSDAFYRGLLELVERDASMHAYLSRRRMKRIVNFPGDIQKFSDYLKRYLLEPFVFDITPDLCVPTVITATVDRTGIGPAVTVGSAAALNYQDAIRRSILESVQCRSYARIMLKIKCPEKFPDEEEVTSLEKRLYYWYPVERLEHLNHWLTAPDTVCYSDLEKVRITARDAAAAVENRGFHIYAVDITLPEIDAAGFQVMSVVVPELLPLYLDERAKALYSAHHGNIPNDPSLKPGPFT